ncbi:MAG TPA: CDP-alcohol phosphatidyltransferase family protein [Actinomycetes bacterium]|nr:CDP-alcohol phosphatidyltransferase family protein [Actinomycetes bacterium]
MGQFSDSGRVVARRVLTPVASVLLRLKVSPDAVTVVGTVGTSVAALYFYPRGDFLVGTLVICLFVFSDSLDGTMARLAGRPSTWGAFLDSTLDRVADAAIFCGIALFYAGDGAAGDGAAGDGGDLTMTAVTLAALVGGLLVSYARARAASLDADASVGIAERTERLVLTLGAAGLSGIFDAPWVLDAALWAVAVLSWVTVIQRIWAVRRQLLPSR